MADIILSIKLKDYYMNVLIVYTHPHKNSLNGSFLEKTLSGLEKNSKISEVEVLDLYEENFNPLLVFNEEIRRRDLHRDPYLTKYRKQIIKADTIIFIYPIWWGRPPAMLMGYIDKIFVSDFAYKKIPGKMMPEGLLKGKKTICISTMSGPTGYLKILMGNAHKILMKRGLFSYVGIKNVQFFEFGDMEKKNGNQKKNLKRIEHVMRKLF